MTFYWKRSSETYSIDLGGTCRGLVDTAYTRPDTVVITKEDRKSYNIIRAHNSKERVRNWFFDQVHNALDYPHGTVKIRYNGYSFNYHPHDLYKFQPK